MTGWVGRWVGGMNGEVWEYAVGPCASGGFCVSLEELLAYCSALKGWLS